MNIKITDTKRAYYFSLTLFIVAFLLSIITSLSSPAQVGAQLAPGSFEDCGVGQTIPEGGNTCKPISQQTPNTAGDDCESLKPANGSTDATANSAYSSCASGYIEGFKGEKTQSQACPSGSARKATCERGYAAGKADKAANRPSQVGPAVNNTNAPGGSGSDDAEESPSCESFGSSPLSWIICPLIEAGTAFTDFVFQNLVEPLLSNNPIDSDSGSATYKAWQGFRLIANIILVISLLILVFAQTTGRGSGMISAYAVKKMAPRILFAAVAINLSIYLVVATVDITNIIGKGLGQMLREPFINAGTFNSIGLQNNIESDVTGAVSAGLLAILIGLLFSGGLVAGLVLLAAGIGLLALALIMAIGAAALAVVVTVVIRYGLVVFLGLVAPIAIACAILPGTEKYFRSWWSLFSKTLLVYPIIAIIFAMSDIMAAIFLNLQANDTVNDIAGVTGVFVALFAVYAPLFLIPFAFKFAGGVMGQLHDFSKKGTGFLDNALLGDAKDPDSLRGRFNRNLASKRAANDLSMKAISSRVNPMNYGTAARRDRRTGDLAAIRTGYAGKYAKEASQSIFAQAGAQVDEVQMDMARYGSSAESLAAIRDGTHISMRGHRNSAMKNAVLASWQGTEEEKQTKWDSLNVAGKDREWQNLSDTNKAQVLGSSEMQTRARQLQMYSATNDRTGRTQATRSAAANSQAALSYGYENGKEGWDQAVEVAEAIYGKGNDAEVLNHMNTLQYVAKQVGRSDLAGNVNSREYNLDRATGSQSTYQLLNGKPHAVKALIEQHLERINSATASDADKRQSAIFLQEMSSPQTKSQATGGVKDTINTYLKDMEDSNKAYVAAEAARTRAVGERTDTVKQVPAQHTVPVPGGQPGETITKPATAAQTYPVEEQVREELSKLSRAPAQLDPNLIENQQQQNKPPDPNNP